MPEIDVSDVLLDPMIAGTLFSVLRRSSVTNNDGIQVSTTTTIPNVRGSVTPTGDNSVVREDAYQTQSKTLSVITPFFLRSSAETLDGVEWEPDLVVWQGDTFLVRVVNDYSQFGAGMIEAECVSFDYTGAPPKGNGP